MHEELNVALKDLWNNRDGIIPGVGMYCGSLPQAFDDSFEWLVASHAPRRDRSASESGPPVSSHTVIALKIPSDAILTKMSL